MEPTLFYVGSYFLVSLFHLASSKVDGYNGWKNSPNVQYHIQTDEGEERYFKYQTKSGQYRKEKRLEDGTVVGTYGWVDPNGYLRLRDYIADNQGYRILKTKMIYVGGNSIAGDSAPGSFRAEYSTLPAVTFHLPDQPHRFRARLPPEPYLPPTPAPSPDYLPPSPAPPASGHPPHGASSTPPPPLVEVSPNSAPRYASTTSSPRVAVFEDPAPKPLAIYASTPKPVAVDYLSAPGSAYGSTPHGIAALGYASATPPPRPSPVAGKFAPFFDRGNNFVAETEKNDFFFRNEGNGNFFSGGSYPDYGSKGYPDYGNNFEEYDGISTVQNGFRYYLPRHYHEEQSSRGGQERTGSFGYIDPFGIRRVIYYNASPGRGFVHRKNNRYVGFNATPYDPRPNF